MNERVYILRPGDALEKLSAIYKIPVCMIARANGLKAAPVLKPGRKLIIPARCYCDSKKELRVHKVRPGDTIYSISKRYSTVMHEILKCNDLRGPNEIEEGMELIIPPRIYTVSATDSLRDIERRTGVSAEAICRINGIKSVYSGMQLMLPY